jgi:hypothetical protein
MNGPIQNFDGCHIRAGSRIITKEQPGYLAIVIAHTSKL